MRQDRDALIGILAVLGFNTLAWLISALLSTPFGEPLWPSVFRFISSSIWLIQFLYLIPIVRYYRYKNRWEMVKGISIGALITIFINSACYGFRVIPSVDIPGIVGMLLVILIMSIAFYAFNRRSGPQ
jgi:hypothetical protein